MGPADWIRGVITAVATWSLYSPPYIRLDLGQRKYRQSLSVRASCTEILISVVVLLGYLVTLLYCITKDAQLIKNANRAGKCVPTM